MEKVRVDKWLWSVRIFKSRTQATDACKQKKISMGEINLKPSALISVGDQLLVKKNGFNFEFLVKKLIEKRVGAPIAIECYENITPEAELLKYENWYVGKSRPEWRDRGAGRPTKKERRTIEEFKEDYFDIDDIESYSSDDN